MSTTKHEFRVLVVDDDPSIAAEIEKLLNPQRVRPVFADTPNAINRVLEAESISLAVVNIQPTTLSLLDHLAKKLRRLDPVPPLVALVDEDPDCAVAAAKTGVEGCVCRSDERAIKRLLGGTIALLTEREESRLALAQLTDIEDRYNLLLESSSESIAYLHEGLHIYANPAYLEQFGYSEFSDVESLSMLDLLSVDDSGIDLKQLLRALSRGELPDEAMAVTAHRSDGSSFQAGVSFSPARFAGERCTQMMVREKPQADDSELHEELEKLRTRDLLTNLLNRQSFLEQIRLELENPDEREGMMAVILVQLDDHVGLQEKLGPGATDALIQQTAEHFLGIAGDERIASRLRDHILAMREWVPTRKEAEQLATRIVEAFSGHILEVQDRSLTVTASVGLAMGGSQTAGMEELVAQAESALGEAARAGGDSYVRFRPRADEGDGGDLSQWEERLRHALNNNDFRMVMLPITSMEDDDLLIQEVEARLRLEDSDEILLPQSYLPAARKAGLASELDRDLASSLVDHLKSGEPEARERWLLPLCATSLDNEEFVDWLQDHVENDRLPARRMIIGVRESEAREQLRQVQKFMVRFASRGVQFALLEVALSSRIEPLLKNIQPNYIKLVPESLAALGRDQEARKNLESIVHAAEANQVKVISPKVENTSDLASLWQFGITLVQDDFLREEA